MRKELPSQPIVVVAQTVTHGLRIVKKFVFVHFVDHSITTVPTYMRLHDSIGSQSLIR